MSVKSQLVRFGYIQKKLRVALKNSIQNRREMLGTMIDVDAKVRGLRLDGSFPATTSGSERTEFTSKDDRLHQYFDANLDGPGINKWLHYFEIYDRHLAKFVGREVNILEIGVYSGGSLGMWRSYFGPQSKIIGVDIEPNCKVYENPNENIQVLLGDQEDRGFWRRFWADAPPVDVIIEDGGHTPSQQMVTLEECLPQLKPGGVYICEDIHGVDNKFNSFVAGLINNLQETISWDMPEGESGPSQLGPSTPASPSQAHLHSIHCYPYIVAIEKREKPFTHLTSRRHGTNWQPHS